MLTLWHGKMVTTHQAPSWSSDRISYSNDSLYLKDQTCHASMVWDMLPPNEGWSEQSGSLPPQLLARWESPLPELQSNQQQNQFSQRAVFLSKRGQVGRWSLPSLWSHYVALSKTHFLVPERSGTHINSPTWAVRFAINHIMLYVLETAMFFERLNVPFLNFLF